MTGDTDQVGHGLARTVGRGSETGGALRDMARWETLSHGSQAPCVVRTGLKKFQQVAGVMTSGALRIERMGERQTCLAEGLQCLVEVVCRADPAAEAGLRGPG
ncbi:hypothetical protein ACWCQM_24145 [Streptomyces sp. NPDC002125]